MKRRRQRRGWGRTLLLAVLGLPLLYLIASLVGSLLPVNRNWEEPEHGTIIYLRSNGIHVDIVMPAVAQGLDWRPYFPRSAFRSAPASPRWFAFGAGERRVYLDTPTWWDLTPRTLWSALTGGERVVHVERTAEPGIELRPIRLRPAEYRRLWASIRSELTLDGAGKPIKIDHPGYFGDDSFFAGRGKASALTTCNNWVADRLRTAGVRTSLWSPFAQGLMWRYRQSRPASH